TMTESVEGGVSRRSESERISAILHAPAHGISSGLKGQVSKGHKQKSTLTVQPASVAGTMLGAVGAAAERGRSGTENPREDGCTSGAAGFLHDVFDVLFDRLFGNAERVRDFLVRMP